ncbi:MAG TPA: DUF92 domain-containing protein [Thermoanaerobaculia bacterium]
MSPLSAADWRRKLVHAGMGLFALTLKYLTWPQAALCAAIALAFNLFVMPRIGRGIYRDGTRRIDVGIVSYAAMVLLLILIFRHHLAIAAAVWGMLAFGDPAAEIAGRTVGGPRLPWNREKTWAGFLACLLIAMLAGAMLYLFVSGAAFDRYAAVVLGATALTFAFLESVRAGIEDNLVAPIPAALVFFGLVENWRLWSDARGPGLPLAALINAILALAGGFLRVVTPSGAVAGFLLGTWILTFGGREPYIILWAFFLLGTVATKWGYAAKAARGVAQEKGGRRGAAHVIANCGVPAAILIFWPIPVLYVSAFAAALADTLGTEFGTLLGKRPFSPLSLRPLPAGTPGAVSWAGTAAGLAGATLIGILAAAIHWILPTDVVLVAFAGAAGSWLESAVVDLGRRRDFRLDHEFANAFNTFAGAVVAFAAIYFAVWIGFSR